jgi:hypothetical protein
MLSHISSFFYCITWGSGPFYAVSPQEAGAFYCVSPQEVGLFYGVSPQKVDSIYYVSPQEVGPFMLSHLRRWAC